MGELTTFPVSVKVAGRKVLVVGGGDEALAKVRLLAKTRADIHVASSAMDVDFSEFAVTPVSRAPVPCDFLGAALVFIADYGPEGRAAERMARAAGIPCNVVDRPSRCDFYTPSIVDRAPLTIAISSEGASPVLARLIRARIEAMLPPALGKLASLAGSLRHKVEALIQDGATRRRFYEALVTSPVIADATGAEALLLRHAAAEAKGEVWLIGAGPGAEDLLTLRAQRLLQEADVIVHDQLVPAAVVEMGRRDAERIPVGKTKGHHSFSQAQINTLLVRLAGEGKRVARLKSGDPMVFGRAGEEIAALRKAGIPYTIVPGVTAALAAAADTASPLTLRKVSSGVVFATAHGADDEALRHWASLAGSGLSLALYMGKSIAAETAARLMAHGLPGATPVGIVVNAGRADRKASLGTLSGLASGAGQFPQGPAVILVGDAVAAGDWADALPIDQLQQRVA
ncbi:uroporphyrin-III C-methyltransferase / precorrin-2 dehydrogenase / sirohydrochlorin ferrochelatase [Devosia enhydra]|uniref:Uroporphyrin-III C-methyltransferase / precorrin-2 dehydrogenase / sirohydrochlorin ferrochelatase n=1 Tax=Devosia enhydra TaxID=665118 RepID=A0A1K2HVI5_9HYPH|nr:siroheme synthase CysG [Devosia enhydra]SFZ82725.1 uroporphyrin-III C-methyltransferase / precorrin-2 dehydrogenase / sirohydrochlorin ferrochelatase [Devosia enhydra]